MLSSSAPEKVTKTFASHSFCVTLAACEKRPGDYDTHQFSDKRVEKPLAKYQEALEDITIDMADE